MLSRACLAVSFIFCSAGRTKLFLDFDDTLFPTSEYVSEDPVSSELVESLHDLREGIDFVLTRAQQVKASVSLITAASESWVESILSSVAPLSALIPAFGAIDKVATAGGSKLAHFQARILPHALNISASDAEIDHVHFWAACRAAPGARCVSFRFLAAPSVPNLVDQLARLSFFLRFGSPNHEIFTFEEVDGQLQVTRETF